MEEIYDIDRVDEVLPPGFRFHPTDEELVNYYLKRKVQQKPLAIELIRQLDIYKFDPWDLPNLAPTTGEKEWYFYCLRDRKYKNSSRPNRVTRVGFWKATGTDRSIYSSQGGKCIGLKKSLVFYRGRASKSTKTDWMMHEFRLPSSCNSMNNYIHPDDSWTICRIFKKTTSVSQKEPNQSIPYSMPINTITKQDIKSPDCFQVQDVASYSPYRHLNVSVETPDNVSEVSMGTGSGEEYDVTLKNALYVSNDELGGLEIDDFFSTFSWESSSCLFDDIVQCY